MFLIFNDIEKAQEALAQIDKNMGLPDGKGTETWAVVQKAHEQDLWFFVAPKNEYLKGVFWDKIEPEVSKYFDRKTLFEHKKAE